MIRALNSAATGMEAQQFQLDTIANNLANAGTTGFKRSRANFEDLYYEHLKLPGQLDAQGQNTPVGQSVGLGVRIMSTQVDHSGGSLTQTNGELDLAITGNGFFQVTDGTGSFYTRAGNFTTNAQGQIVMAGADRGYFLEPTTTLPQNYLQLTVSPEGIIAVREPNQTDLTQAGTVSLVRFQNPQGLLQIGENLYAETPASGTAIQGQPGADGLGTIRQRFLENSNVEPVLELVELIKTQRNFELNSQVVQVADEQMQLVANLRRF